MAAIPAAQMLDKLLTLDDVRERLEPTEGLSEHTFDLDGSQTVHFSLPPGWNTGLADRDGQEVVDASLTLGGTEYQMTKDAALEATSLIGLTKVYCMTTPGPLVETHLNYWTSHKPNKAMKALVKHNRILAFTKATITPFSNLQLLDTSVKSLRVMYGEPDVYADYKFHHDLRRTSVRLIVPGRNRTIQSARSSGSDDKWSVGVQIRNSLVGEKPLSLQGYLFAWFCTNGAISTHASSGRYNRRVQGQGEEVYAWAQQSVDEILGGLEHELDAVQDLTTVPVQGELHQALADIFAQYSVPVDARQRIIENLAESDDLSMYGVMSAITAVANGDLPDAQVTALMEVGGDLPRATSDRCNACHRLAV